ncbi:unnamed protein product [Orchesella dallaii]|uniref:NADH:ubiquinone oxidoreductase intermediate-associated protein 30 domain-containing protein n=1 Tax=Orchesella dallaii TaxID=48710 RepID=A0ABP1QU89_9HEXA
MLRELVSRNVIRFRVPLSIESSHLLARASGSLELSNNRSLHTSSCSCGLFWESSPKGEYRDQKKYHEEIGRKQRENLWGLKDGLKDLRDGVAQWTEEWKEQIREAQIVCEGDHDKAWTFENPEKLKHWTTICDSDHNEGFSRCDLTISPTGKGLFHGFVNTTAPKDGRVKNAGFCAMASERPMMSFGRKSYHDWSQYTHLTMRIRGDGRSYIINIGQAGYYDIMWNDVYHYVLFTRGGPYWQKVKIPFSKFIFGSKGRIQDNQIAILLNRVSNFQIAAGKVDGPFCLEIDYIGLENDNTIQEEFAYEMYRIPKFIANV